VVLAVQLLLMLVVGWGASRGRWCAAIVLEEGGQAQHDTLLLTGGWWGECLLVLVPCVVSCLGYWWWSCGSFSSRVLVSAEGCWYTHSVSLQMGCLLPSVVHPSSPIVNRWSQQQMFDVVADIDHYKVRGLPCLALLSSRIHCSFPWNNLLLGGAGRMFCCGPPPPPPPPLLHTSPRYMKDDEVP
jgi:hypothetical protein